MTGFIDKYFLIPLQANQGYNFVNTITYAAIALILLLAIYKVFEKLKVKIDFKFFISLLPFIVFGSSIRALVDHGMLPYRFWFISPGIYLLTAAIFLGAFLSSFLIEKYATRGNALKGTFVFGTLLDIIIWVYAAFNGLQFQNLLYGSAIVGLAVTTGALLYFIFKHFKFTDRISFLPFPAHLLDASATFIAVDFLGFSEEHPLPVFMSNLAGTAAVMYLLKLAVLIPAVYLIRKEINDKNMANYLLIAIAVLGLAEGLRNLLTVVIA
ncbi:MAG: DUF63 family protein [archaeon]